jgi:hypothetical protein
MKASRVRALRIMPGHAAKVRAKRQIAAAAAYVRAELDAESASTRSSRPFPIRPRKI